MGEIMILLKIIVIKYTYPKHLIIEEVDLWHSCQE